MPCASPLKAYRPANGGPVRFNQPRDGKAYTPMDIPCGQCILCRLEHARQWAVRITHEASQWPTNSFITLTYSDEHLPEHGSLQYDHLEKFWKRLRKRIGKLRYYAVGEYGDEHQRPHYHACVFGHDFTEEKEFVREGDKPLWTNKVLQETWGLGRTSAGALTFETAQYTAAYVTKKLNNEKRYVRIDEESGELVDLEQPQARMSRRPAIGATWLNKYGNQVFAWDEVVINGRPQKPPKFYDRWLEKRSEIAMQMIKDQRKEGSRKYTEEESRARARNAHARTKKRRRE